MEAAAGRGGSRKHTRCITATQNSDSWREAAADSRSLTDSFLFVNQQHLIWDAAFFFVFVLLVESLIATLMFSGAESSAQETIQTATGQDQSQNLHMCLCVYEVFTVFISLLEY